MALTRVVRSDRSTRCGQCARDRAAWRRLAHPVEVLASIKRSTLRSRYNLTPADLAALVSLQQGRCAICGQQRILLIDHDHDTGAVRGLLCRPCNTSLGQFGDSPQMLQEAIAYLGKPR